jgi:hypothetical protein
MGCCEDGGVPSKLAGKQNQRLVLDGHGSLSGDDGGHYFTAVAAMSSLLSLDEIGRSENRTAPSKLKKIEFLHVR